MKKEIIWSIAFAMIFLVITIPFYVSDAFAQNSGIDHVVYPTPTGTGNVSKFMLSTDTLTIVANLRALGVAEADVPNKVFANFGAKEPFQSCKSLGSQWYDCTYQKQFSDVPGGNYQGKITLEADQCTSGCDAQVDFNVDGIPPKFSSFTITPRKTNGENVSISYSATDSACLAGCGQLCAGIKTILLYPSNNYANILANLFVNQSPNSPSGCLDVRTFQISVGNLSSGNYSICIAGIDNLGNTNLSGTCQNLVIAKNPPTVGTPVITDEQGNAILFLSPGGAVASLSVNITSQFADLSSAVVDLSPFQYSNQTMSCSNINGTRIWKCISKFYALIPTGASTETVPIYAYDDAGNAVKATFVFGIQRDSNSPSLSAFRTNYMFSNISFFGPHNNQISLDIVETQSGLSENKTYVQGLENYFDVGAQVPSALYQGQCRRAGNLWSCSWPALELQASAAEANLQFSVYDGVDNFPLQFSENVPIDKQPPQLVSVEMDTQNTYPAVGVGDGIVMRANITDRSSVVDSSGNYNISMDFSNIEEGADLREADSCELKNTTYQGGKYLGSQWICSWIIASMPEAHSWIPSVVVSDIEGNSQAYYEYPKYIAYVNSKTGNISLESVSAFEVFPREENVSNHWNVEAGEAMPQSLDRQILQVISPFVYVPLRFIPLHGKPQILEVTLQRCQNDGTASKIDIFPNGPDARDIEVQILNGDYGQGEYENKEFFKYPCKIGIISIADGKLTQKEINDVTIKIGLYNMPLGSFDKKVREKVDWIHEQEQSLLTKTLAFLKQALDWLNFLCNIYNTIVTISTIFHLAMLDDVSVWEALSAVFAPAYPVKEAISAASKSEHVALGGISKFMEPICHFSTCTLPGWQSMYYKIRDIMSGQAAEGLANAVTKKGQETGTLHDIVAGGAPSLIQFWPASMQDSLILSMVFLCVPGVIYNLEKYRQIQCNYGYCTLQMAASGGPLKGCEEEYKVQTCIAVVGEIFNVIPYGASFASINSFLQTVLHDPISFVFFAVGLTCWAIPDALPAEVCIVTNVITNALGFIAGLLAQYQDISAKMQEGKSAFTTTDICKQFEKAYEDMKI